MLQLRPQLLRIEQVEQDQFGSAKADRLDSFDNLFGRVPKNPK